MGFKGKSVYSDLLESGQTAIEQQFNEQNVTWGGGETTFFFFFLGKKVDQLFCCVSILVMLQMQMQQTWNRDKIFYV